CARSPLFYFDHW
nr:immunoglobulin heavy chain junction region [Mus musculus]NSM08353.1 immunoglobulin heavy chain junction region [Mus musculus]